MRRQVEVLELLVRKLLRRLRMMRLLLDSICLYERKKTWRNWNLAFGWCQCAKRAWYVFALGNGVAPGYVHLKNNQHVFTSILNIFKIRKLLRFGGRDGRSTARTLASELIADDIYMRYSWNGTLSKASFCNFKELIDVVLSVVRYQHPDFTMQELIKFYQDHLKQAKFRLNRKM